MANTAFSQDPSNSDAVLRSRHGMVASDSPEASRIGAQILAEGGNAFDAAIATSFALAITRPESTGLGGGGFMLGYVAKANDFVILDFRETAPKAATAELFSRLHAEAGDGPSPAIYGGAAVATPALVLGLAEIHKRFASKTLNELLRPAIALSRQGFLVDRTYNNAVQDVIDDFRKHPEFQTRFALLWQTYLNNGQAPPVGTRVKPAGVTFALEQIAANGPAAFRVGDAAYACVTSAQAVGGVLAREDLENYQVRERRPLRFRYGRHEIVAMPPPSSGGIVLAETLQTLAHSPAYQQAALDSPLRTHLLLEALKHGFADRSRWHGDADFADVPFAKLTSDSYAAELAGRLSPDHVSDPESYGVAAQPDDRGTSHFCVADRDGNVVSMTETINGTYGSYVVVLPYGFVLNNQMDDFATDLGRPNLYGLRQGAANAVAPGKRPLSSMAPTIVLEEGKPVLALGASGGPRIISSVLHVLLNVIERKMPLERALTALRPHHQWQPDEVFLDRDPLVGNVGERGPEAERRLLDELKRRGHVISDKRRGAVVQAIQFTSDGEMIGGSDPRKGGKPASP